MATLLDHRGEPARRDTRQVVNEFRRELYKRLAGLQYDDDRDVWEVAGYPDNYTFDKGFSHYKRQHIASRIVDMPAQTTWRNEPSVQEPGSAPEEDTRFEAAWRGLFEDHRLSHHWERLDRMAGLGRFAIQLLGFDDISDARELEEPVGGPGPVTRLLFVSEFDEGDVTIETLEDEPDNPRHGQPNLYRVDLSSDVGNFSGRTMLVHHTRVIHLIENPLTDEVFGQPRLEPVLNLLIDLEKITAATGESYWQEAVPILSAKVDPRVSSESFASHKEDLSDDLEELVHDLRRHFLGQGVELSKLGGSTPDPSDPVEMLKGLIGAAAGIPQRILFGSERGELASTQDTREWLGRIGERQVRLAEPQVVRPFTDRMIEHDILPEPSDGYEVEWPNLFEQTEEEEAEIASTRAQTVKVLTEAMMQGGEQAMRLAAELMPELGELLDEQAGELERFREEEDAESEAEVGAALSNGGGPDELELPAWLLDR